MAECLNRLVVWVYCLELNTLVIWCVYAALVFSAFCRACADRRWLRPGLAAVFGIWLAAVLLTTIFSRTPRVGSANWLPLDTYRRVLQGDTTELLRSALMNVALFFPAGLLSAALLPRGSGRRMVLGFALFSLAIEVGQDLFQLGFAEMDDVLHNTLGAALGYMAFRRDLDLPSPH